MTRRPRVGQVDWGSLRTTAPISREFGFDRGTPVDRYYIEAFLESYGSDVCGHVLETGTDMYTVRYGGERVVRSDVLHHAEGNPRATILADLSEPNALPAGRFDCIICTQTLQFVFDVDRAIANLHDALRPRGVLLLTASGISQISRPDMETTGEFWRFTDVSIRRLLTRVFPETEVEVRSYGNALSCVAFLHGIAKEELTEDELDVDDASYQMVTVARAVRPA